VAREVPSRGVGYASARTYSNVLVVPMTDLLISAEREHVGGPIWPDWDTADWAGYWRSGTYGYRRVDRRPYSAEPRKRLRDAPYFWVGPFYNHFGHQIQDFSSRVLGSLAVQPEARLVYALRDGQSSCPEWFWQINDWFGVPRDRIVLVSEPTLFPNLGVVPQPEWAGANPENLPPDPEYVNALTAHAQAQFDFRSMGKSGRYFVSRAKLPSGSNILGESAIAKQLARSGFVTVFPETLDLRDQLRLYVSAEALLFSAGSAIHGLQLLGRNVGDVAVLRRHPDGSDYTSILATRCERFTEIDCVASVYAFGGRLLGAGAKSTLDLRCLPVSLDAAFGKPSPSLRFRRFPYLLAVGRDAVKFLLQGLTRRTTRLLRRTEP
jgi:hypothetical protein